MRIVADTNTVVAGLFWDGPPRRILALARDQIVTLCTSAALIEELAAVIAREKFAQRLQSARVSGKVLLEDYVALTELVLPTPLAAPICRDPDDDHVLACAMAARAEVIVTGDDDLLVLNMFNGIAILRPADAMARIAAGRR